MRYTKAGVSDFAYLTASGGVREGMVFCVIVGLIFTADLLIKNLVERFVLPGRKKYLIPGRVYLTKYHNKGAALNFMEGKRVWVAVCSAALSLVCTIVFVLTMTHGGRNSLKTGLALLLGGAYSNTYDRLRRRYVVDYVGIRHRKGSQNDVIYNLSDFCIIIGALLMVLSQIRANTVE